jgi:lipopolysaccharide transport system ATP-binding protein
MGAIIKVENLSKQYRLGEIGTGSLSHDINRWWHQIRGKENPYLKIGEANDRSTKGESEYVWSLKDINFEIEQGDAVGIIGRNGAGKSTLLKILSRVTGPTTGSVKVKGRIASLLEVGTGFHPELSGRDNIFLNGAILGMRKTEIKRHFDEIVDFSGVERYIDTPVKRYSSGMYVRLAFAVAAHLESEILIVDEVLAVGDTEFQKKCLGKMGQVNQGEGRTVLFVSHNMGSIIRLCNKGILLANGLITHNGDLDNAINNYLNEEISLSEFRCIDDESKDVQILNVRVTNNQNILSSEFRHDEAIIIFFDIKNKLLRTGVRCNLAFLDKLEQIIFVERIEISDNKKLNSFKVIIAENQFIPNSFKLSIAIDIPSIELLDVLPQFLTVNIIDTGANSSKNNDVENGLVIPRLNFYEI